MGRRPCCDKLGVKKGPWTAEEDRKLVGFMTSENSGHCCWRMVPKLAGLRRCGKSCRLRWTNYLRPDLKRGLLSEFEEQLIIDLHSRLGNRYIILFPLLFSLYCMNSWIVMWSHCLSVNSYINLWLWKKRLTVSNTDEGKSEENWENNHENIGI